MQRTFQPIHARISQDSLVEFLQKGILIPTQLSSVTCLAGERSSYNLKLQPQFDVCTYALDQHSVFDLRVSNWLNGTTNNSNCPAEVIYKCDPYDVEIFGNLF